MPLANNASVSFLILFQATANTKNQNSDSQPNVSTTDELPINAVEHASANANATNDKNESFACTVTVPDIIVPDITFEISDVDYSDTNDLGAIADDGKIAEFMDYIEKVDLERANSENKLNFREYLDEPPHRIRHTSYNYDGKDNDSDELNVNVMSDEEPFEDTGYDSLVHDVNQTFLDVERNWERRARRRSSDTTNDSRKSSMTLLQSEMRENFADGMIFNHNPLQRIQKVDNSPNASRKSSIDIKLLSPSESQASINEIDFVFVENAVDVDVEFDASDFKELETSRTQIHEISSMKPPKSRSVSYAGMGGGHTSIVSSGIPSEPLTESTPKLSDREDSWISVESRMRYERSQSRYSDLEYIPGRDDWRAVKGQHLEDQIDSDNYHHHRRYSETTDTLEYIKGRDDWLCVESNQRRRSSTSSFIDESKIRLDIRDEVDADEYHHHRCLEDIVAYANKTSHYIFLAQGSARSGRERSPYRVLRTDINKDELIERYIWRAEDADELHIDTGDDDATFLSADDSRIRTEKYIWVADDARSGSKSPLSVTSITIDDKSIGGDETQIIIPSSSIGHSSDAGSIDISVVTEDEFTKSTVEIHNIIDHTDDASDKNHIFTTGDESIEVMVVNLKDNSSNDEFDDPIIVISRIDEALDTTGVDEKGIVSPENEYSDDISTEQNTEFINTIENLTDLLDSIESSNKSNTDMEDRSISTTESTFTPIVPSSSMNSKSNSSATRTTGANTKTNDTKTRPQPKSLPSSQAQPRKIAQSDSLDDLIKEGSMGIWFHK